MSTRRIYAAASAAVVALSLGACNSGGEEPDPGTMEPTEETTTEETTSPPEETTAPTEEPTEDDDGADEDETDADTTGPEDEPTADLPEFSSEAAQDPDWPSGGGDLLHSTVRIGDHEGFDRVVFDLIGSDTPGYRVEYVEEATTQGKGEVVELDGEAILQVVITGTRYPEEGEEYPGGPGNYDPEDTGVVEEVHLDGTFEGQTQAFIGVDGEAPFRVFTLADPVRLVVDVQHTDG